MPTKWMNKNKRAITQLYPNCVVYGPYVNSKDGRRRIVIFDGVRRIAKQYAKLKMEVRLGCILSKDETVDHIDRDFLNDKYKNLQILDKLPHARKDALRRKSKSVKCVWCGTRFILSKHQVNTRSKSNAGPFCSRSCTGSYGASLQGGANKLKRKTVKITYEYA